ncbi:MAG: hypothetical protein U0900_23110 [Myxococcota bacterium]
MTDYQIAVIREGWLPLLVQIAAVATLWRGCSPQTHVRRVAACSPGLWFSAAFIYAVLICPFSDDFSHNQSGLLGWPFSLLVLGGTLATPISLAMYEGRRVVLIVYFLSFPGAIYLSFVGAMAMAHDWL